MTDFLEIGRMTIKEYRIRMKAHRLKHLDQEYFIHLQAFKNQQIQATKGSGKNVKPLYSTFEEFFPYNELQNEILDIKKVVKPKTRRNNKKIVELLRKANS